ncbi:MAG: DNA translocase FtsK [Candidatus Omnitrophica bacterium]|nr:DNA translocase FtsK [Candidatus Omnitrophota bacterium]MBU1128834.1 DNA translocase FtsK [Candidatus Omnitrophota bacterium]MBU1783773.1 DNA translocase FtsK [Candidatus Omnitrophota bacterium]MBU1852134.1 DNA translocase FtsK [Candidatus Omnitrophota bacterium]
MDDVRKNEIVAVVLFAISLFVFLSIFTFNEYDLPFYASDTNLVPRNLTGIVGSYLSGVMLFLVGKAAYVLPLLILVWGISRLLQLKPRKIFFKIFGTIFLVTAAGASLSMMNYATRTIAFASGGLVGSLVSEFLLKYLGTIGAVVFVSSTIVLSLLIATEFLILPVFAGLLKKAARILERIVSLTAGKGRTSNVTVASGGGKLKDAKAEIARKLEVVRKQVEESRRATWDKKEEREMASRGDHAPGPKVVAVGEIRKAPAASARVTSVSNASDGGTLFYKLPGLDLLKDRQSGGETAREEDLKMKAALLEKTLLEFGVAARVVKINRGPVVTMYELEPAIGTKVNRITSLGDNISLVMKSANIRIVAPLPGKGTIGIEVPNDKSEIVRLKCILESEEYCNEESPLKLALGKDLSGIPMVVDLAAMPHLLIAGATGSGKTVCINCVICSMLLSASPEELKFIMVDPKRVELMMFEGIPHLISPIVTVPKKVAVVLGWLIGEMERRYDLFAAGGVRNITRYKEKAKADWENLPYIVVIIDELADLMAVSQQDIEGAIMRLAQLSRAAGIHMILATQRPSVNVITGVIKANFPARISFKVASKVDSRTVLDANGAEKLLGRGDMLLMEPGRSNLVRGQCSLVEDSEIRDVVKFIKDQTGSQYLEEVAREQAKSSAGVRQEKDELYEEAVKVVLQTKQASVSMVQRRLRVGYTRAARMVDIMEADGIVGPYNGQKAREILIENMDELGNM